MAKYCDSAKLEQNWLCWLMASKTPELEPFRALGVLWSKPVEYVSSGTKSYPSPTSKRWLHCVAVGAPFYFASEAGALYQHPDSPVNTHGMVPEIEWLDLASNHACLKLDNPFWVQCCLMPSLLSSGYIQEQPVAESWRYINDDILHTCQGVARKFIMTEEDRADLVQEAATQIIRKLRHSKLVYQPGKAPVFNLLTTTIHRCMFSILNKGSRTKKSTSKLVADMKIGAVPKQFRSFRVPNLH